MISILMLTYNREQYIKRAIESVLGQTLGDFEFVIVDNGSTDQSGAVAEAYTKTDNRVRVIHRERGNIGAGRNTALDAAKGDYVVFVDDDDWCEPDYLEFLHSLAVDNGADASICGSADRMFDEKIIMTATEALVELLWRRRYSMAFPTKMFRRELLENLRFPEEGTYDDIALMYRLLARPKKVVYHGLAKYTFFRHENNNSAWTTDHSLLSSETLDEYLRVYRERTQWLCSLFPSKAELWRYFEWSFMISMVEKIERLGLHGCEKQHADMTRELRANYWEFMDGGFVLDYEKGWMDRYIQRGIS